MSSIFCVYDIHNVGIGNLRKFDKFSGLTSGLYQLVDWCIVPLSVFIRAIHHSDKIHMSPRWGLGSVAPLCYKPPRRD